MTFRGHSAGPRAGRKSVSQFIEVCERREDGNRRRACVSKQGQAVALEAVRTVQVHPRPHYVTIHSITGHYPTVKLLVDHVQR